jgi:hypothetical protein
MDAFISDYLVPLMDSRAWARVLILGGIALGLWLGLGRTSLDRRQRTTTWLAVILPLLAWYLVIWQFARSGGFQTRLADGSPPLVPMAIFLPLLVALPLLIRSKRMAAVLDAVSPAWLVGFQVYRVLGYVFLVRWSAGELPGTFALPAGIGDVLVGVLALPVAFYLQSGATGGRAAAYAWNALGILDLLVAVTLGALTATGRLPVDVPNVAASSFPLVMIPAFAVPLSLILHGVSLWQLMRRTRATASALSAQPMPGSL